MKKMFFYFILVQLLWPLDKVYLHTGDVLKMKVEDINSEKVFLSDNLNRVVIAVEQVKFIEYEQKQVIHLNAEAGQQQGAGGLWQISHYNSQKVFLLNSKTKETRWVKREKIEEKILYERFAGLWGIFIQLGSFTTTGGLADSVENGLAFSASLTRKQAERFFLFDYFWNIDLGYSTYTSSLSNQGIKTWHAVPQAGLPLFSNEYGRIFVIAGLGPALLSTFNQADSKTDFTFTYAGGLGAELFMLPYLGFRLTAEYRTFLQGASASNLTGFFIAGSIGYYFID